MYHFAALLLNKLYLINRSKYLNNNISFQSTHVESQAGKENYVCLWEQCKVRGKPSCSRLWLERHALSHGGNKPFKCIVDGCDRRFSTQVQLRSLPLFALICDFRDHHTHRQNESTITCSPSHRMLEWVIVYFVLTICYSGF